MQFVDIISFLRDFYGISSPSLKFKKIKHQDLRILFPFIKRCSINNLNMEDLFKGNIIGVYDKSNMILYYYNPHIIEISDIFYDDNEEVEEDFCFNYDNNVPFLTISSVTTS